LPSPLFPESAGAFHLFDVGERSPMRRGVRRRRAVLFTYRPATRLHLTKNR
jgi:hypothetical protein